MTIDDKGNFYIADTENYRVIISDGNGIVKGIITRPDAQLADTEAPFRATKVLLDRKGLIYVICDSINLGAFVVLRSQVPGDVAQFAGPDECKVGVDAGLDHVDHWLSDKCDHNRSDSLECLQYIFVILECCEEHRYHQNDQEGWETAGDCGYHAAFRTAQPVSSKYGDVYREKTGSGLGQRDDVNEILVVQPFQLCTQILYFGGFLLRQFGIHTLLGVDCLLCGSVLFHCLL